MKKHHFQTGAVLFVVGAVGFGLAVSLNTKAEVIAGLDPESGAATCPAGFLLEDFEDGAIRELPGNEPVLTTKLPGVEFSTIGQVQILGGSITVDTEPREQWFIGSSPKYPQWVYTHGGEQFAYIGSQSVLTKKILGLITFTDVPVSYVSVYASASVGGVMLEAYADDGTFLESSGLADANTNTGTMAQLSIARTTADIGYVVVRSRDNWRQNLWRIDWLCISKDADKVQEVNIDVKPDGLTNSINIKSKGSIPVALLGSDTFDVTTAILDTIIFDGAIVDKASKSPQDVNDDGYLDLVLHFKTQALQLLKFEPLEPSDNSYEACLVGSTTNDTRFEGCDLVEVLIK